jgi:hypothetical protein
VTDLGRSAYLSFDGLRRHPTGSRQLMPELVKHRGVSVTADWPARIAGAQELTHYSSRGRRFPRIRYGEDDQHRGDVPCRDCAVIKGEFHVPDCEYEHCPVCRAGPLQSCDCPLDELGLSRREPAGPAGGVLGKGSILVLIVTLVLLAAGVLWVFIRWLPQGQPT